MTDHPLDHLPAAPEIEAQLDEGQRAYESLFGLVPEWHQQPSTGPQDDPAAVELDDDALYAALFGTNPQETP